MSEYVLYTDKSENFQCEIDVEGASLKNSIARIVIESNDLNIMFNGTIENGKCNIPIKKMKGILEENCSGTMKLEVIVEDTYFSPWSSDFKVKPSKKMNVVVKEQLEPIHPKVSVTKVIVPQQKQEVAKQIKTVKPQQKNTIIEKSDTRVVAAISELVSLLAKKGINESTLHKKMNSAQTLINEYFQKNNQYQNKKDEIVKKTMKVILDK